jgi:hypothetical protein
MNFRRLSCHRSLTFSAPPLRFGRSPKMYQGLFDSLAICLSPFPKSLLLRVICVCCDRRSAGTDQCNHQFFMSRPYPTSQVRAHSLTVVQSWILVVLSRTKCWTQIRQSSVFKAHRETHIRTKVYESGSIAVGVLVPYQSCKGKPRLPPLVRNRTGIGVVRSRYEVVWHDSS